MATNGDIDAFEGFKFELGDTVVHVTDRACEDTVPGLVLERLLIQTTAGIQRRYVVSFRAAETTAEEMELAKWFTSRGSGR